MSLSGSVSRFTDYFKRNGVRATARRLSLAAKRALFSSSSVLFYCDLTTLRPASSDLPKSLKVERHSNQSGISPADLQEIINIWNPERNRRNLKERFGLGASLWLSQQTDPAVRALQKAVALAPDQGDYRFRLGSAYNETGHYAEAIPELRRAARNLGAPLAESCDHSRP